MLNKNKSIILIKNIMQVNVLPLFNTKNRLFPFVSQSAHFQLISIILYFFISICLIAVILFTSRI